jgi:hypothetical protein
MHTDSQELSAFLTLCQTCGAITLLELTLRNIETVPRLAKMVTACLIYRAGPTVFAMASIRVMTPQIFFSLRWVAEEAMKPRNPLVAAVIACLREMKKPPSVIPYLEKRIGTLPADIALAKASQEAILAKIKGLLEGIPV